MLIAIGTKTYIEIQNEKYSTLAGFLIGLLTCYICIKGIPSAASQILFKMVKPIWA